MGLCFTKKQLNNRRCALSHRNHNKDKVKVQGDIKYALTIEPQSQISNDAVILILSALNHLEVQHFPLLNRLSKCVLNGVYMFISI